MQVSLRDILNKIFMNGYYLLTFSLVLIVFTTIYLLTTKKIYQSQAKILVKLGFEQTGPLSLLNFENVYISKRKQDLKNEAEILTSNEVLEKTAKEILGIKAKNLKVLDKTIKMLSSNLKVNPLYESDTLEVTFRYDDPILAQKILKLIIKNYMNLHIHIFSSKRELNVLEREVKKYRGKLKSIERKLTEFMKSNNFYGDKNQLDLLLKQKNTITTNLIQAIADYKYTLNKVKKLKNIIREVQKYILSGVTEIRNRNLENIESQIRQLEIQKQKMLMRYQPTSRFIRDLDEEINLLKKLKSTEPEYVVEKKEKRVSDYYRQLQEMLLRYETEMQGNKSKIEVYKKQLEEINKRIEKYLNNLYKYKILNKDLSLIKYLYENFSKSLSQTKLKLFSEKQKILNISIIEPPSLNMDPVWPKYKFIIIMALALLIIGNISIITLFSFFDTRIKFPNELEAIYKGKLISDFPLYQYKQSSEYIDVNDDLFSNSIREFQRIFVKIGDSRVIHLTSCSHKEGVTTLGVNFANFLSAYHEKNVGYICFNTLFEGEVYNYSENRFTSSFMNIYKVSFYNFNFDFSSPDFENTNFENLKFLKNFLLELKEEFDIVFLDISPIYNVLNFIYLTDIIEKTITIIEAEKIKKEVLTYNIGILEDFNISNVSFVLNKRKYYIPEFLIKYV